MNIYNSGEYGVIFRMKRIKIILEAHFWIFKVRRKINIYANPLSRLLITAEKKKEKKEYSANNFLLPFLD